MIQAVQQVQQTKCSAIEAQAAVHIGAVGTGVIGTYRWQYKCCSSDMLVARDLACQGLPGKVCATEPCISCLPINTYDIRQGNFNHGLATSMYYIQPISSNRKISSAVVKLGRRLNQIESVANLMRLDSVDEDGPFFTQLCQSNESKPAMTTCLLEGKAFVHRLAHDTGNTHVTGKSFQQAVQVGSVEQETSEQLNFFTLAFQDASIQSSFAKESEGFGLTLVFMLLLLVAISVLHFALLPRTMLLLSSMLFLFIFLSLVSISVIASKLKVVRCHCLSRSNPQLTLIILSVVLIATTCLINLLTCQSSSFYHLLPMVMRYGILSPTNSQSSQNTCSSPYYMFISGILVLFVISVTRISHIVQAILITIVSALYTVIVVYTHEQLFHTHDIQYREGLPPSTVMAIVALVHFAIMHILIGRHSEWVRKLDFIWQHKKTSCHQNAQDMTTLRLGVVENALPSHVIGHYSNAECVVKPFCKSHNLAGVAFLTIPNFASFAAEMHQSNQSLLLMQVLHDVTSAFDHLLRRPDFQLIEKVYNDGLTYVLVSGISGSSAPYGQHGGEQDYAMKHLCKLVDLLLDMKHCLMQLNAMAGRNLVLRAGVSIGPVVEGVLGYKMPQYNIWGPAVEMARMLELSGKVNHIQVNKEVAQILRRRFQFQPRSHGNMPVLQELQPYIVVSRRLQSVIASDNESDGSQTEVYQRSRSPRVHNHSVGTLSQAETVLISSQQYPFQSAPSQARVRIPSYEMKTDWPPGMLQHSNSAGSTPSSSFTRNFSKEGGFAVENVFKIPESSSLIKVSSRSKSPCELPAVHYAKNRTPPIQRLHSSDSRGTIILTQANLTGNPPVSSAHLMTHTPEGHVDFYGDVQQPMSSNQSENITAGRRSIPVQLVNFLYLETIADGAQALPPTSKTLLINHHLITVHRE
ncbi:hypothetical protein EB796_022459 [Bugula neritina]|uniref:adenylate cyclase n=1 Tax=Bugula neritina TaxID=10212 RepID=A0A7J7IZB1_BUGNE|nr:hypothetical protein EB796_022459 [Bugula neritina]